MREMGRQRHVVPLILKRPPRHEETRLQVEVLTEPNPIEKRTGRDQGELTSEDVVASDVTCDHDAVDRVRMVRGKEGAETILHEASDLALVREGDGRGVDHHHGKCECKLVVKADLHGSNDGVGKLCGPVERLQEVWAKAQVVMKRPVSKGVNWVVLGAVVGYSRSPVAWTLTLTACPA